MSHTPGPWQWFGNGSRIYLATTHSGRRYVMDFVRLGLQGAQPRFQTKPGLMQKATDLAIFEVGERGVVGIESAKNDDSVYRYDIIGLDSADARLIAASPDLLEFAKDVHAYLDALPNLPDNDELAQFADRAEALIKAAG